MAACIVLGFCLTIQVRSVYKLNTVTGNNDLKRAEDLQKQLYDQQAKNDALANQVKKLQSSLQDYRDKATENGSANQALLKQLGDAEIMAGLKDVHGPGVIVTMNDGTLTSANGQDTNAFIIHDTDILQVLNELRDAGAEALSINDERVLSTTEVRCAGNTISVNNDRCAAPFVIRAIGDQNKLKSALLMKNGIVDMLTQWGIEISVDSSSDLSIKAYEGSPEYRYAKSSSK